MAYRRFKLPVDFSESAPATLRQLRQNLPINPEVSQTSQAPSQEFWGAELSNVATVAVSQASNQEFEGDQQPTVADVATVAGVNPAWDELDWIVAFEERAGILEFDEGLPRWQAAKLARRQIDELRHRTWR